MTKINSLSDLITELSLLKTLESIKSLPSCGVPDLQVTYSVISVLLEVFPDSVEFNKVNDGVDIGQLIQSSTLLQQYMLSTKDDDGFHLGNLIFVPIANSSQIQCLFIGDDIHQTTPMEHFVFSLTDQSQIPVLIGHRQFQVKRINNTVLFSQGSNRFINDGVYVVNNMNRFRPLVLPVRSNNLIVVNEPINVFSETKEPVNELYT